MPIKLVSMLKIHQLNVKAIVDRAGDLQTLTQDAFDSIQSGIADFDEIVDPVELYTLI